MTSRANVRPALSDLTHTNSNAFVGSHQQLVKGGVRSMEASNNVEMVDKENVLPILDPSKMQAVAKGNQRAKLGQTNKSNLNSKSNVVHRHRQPLQSCQPPSRVLPSRKASARAPTAVNKPSTTVAATTSTSTGFTIFSDELLVATNANAKAPLVESVRGSEEVLSSMKEASVEDKEISDNVDMEVGGNDVTLDSIHASDHIMEKDDDEEDDDDDDDDDELADDIYRFLRGAELRHMCKWNYMSKQPDITFSMRSVLVDWLIEVAEEYKMHSETIFLAVNYIDRFLSHMSVERAKLQLVGTACIFIASKYEEIYPPDVSEFIYITDDTYTKKQLLKMEALVLNVLNFKMAAPTVLQFLDQFAVATQCDSETRWLSIFLSELSLVDGERFLSYRSSVVAAASVALARHTLGHPAWPDFAAETFSIAVDDFKECLVSLHQAFTNAPSASQQAVREKYKQQKYQAVALLKPTPIYQ